MELRADEVNFPVAERYRGADLKSIGMLLRAEWGLTAAEADEAVREFFQEVPQP